MTFRYFPQKWIQKHFGTELFIIYITRSLSCTDYMLKRKACFNRLAKNQFIHVIYIKASNMRERVFS